MEIQGPSGIVTSFSLFIFVSWDYLESPAAVSGLKYSPDLFRLIDSSLVPDTAEREETQSPALIVVLCSG